tara:strand:+ start:732 stop:2552 length:1821 start_codon:yes stop_codon:yes gene_type:complete
MNILGISAFYHDSSATLLVDGNIIAAVEEERFTRIKHDKSFPFNSINYCLTKANLSINDIDCVGYYEKPLLKFSRIISSYISHFPFGFNSYFRSMPHWLANNSNIKNKIKNNLNYNGEIIMPSHHMSHMSSAYYPSPFLDSAIISMDGVGEWSSLAIGIGENNHIEMLDTINFPHSLGLLYSAFTLYCGFKVNSGEYKLMGLAPYGEPYYVNKIFNNLIDLKDDGSFKINMDYFDYSLNENMINEKFNELFGQKPRKAEDDITPFYMNIASSIQKVTESIILKITQHVKNLTNKSNLCLAGGVALNCVANSKILRQNIFKDIWIQPASGDSGGSLGSAYYIWHQKYKKEKSKLENKIDYQSGSTLGSEYNNKFIKKFLKNNKIVFDELPESDLNKKIAEILKSNKIIGRFSGRMEYGPRALGNRSILANPLDKKVQEKLNLKIKFRENFRPFAPSVMYDKLEEWFILDDNRKITKSPYMLLVADVIGHKKSINSHDNWKDMIANNISPLPGITHVDGSARVQTVHPNINERFYNLIKEFYKISSCPVVINTSFNIRGEPIVESPNDAYQCFINTGMDYLVLENCIIDKSLQTINLSNEYFKKFELD